MIYLLQIAQGKLRDHNSAMEVAAEQALKGENAKGFPHRIARDAEGSGQRKFLQWSAGPKLAIEDTLAEDRSDLVRDTDAVDLGTLHAVLAGRASRAALCDGMVTLSSGEMLSI
jgi:hypothetical protein